MDFPKKDLSELTNALLAGTPSATWETPSDLSRISVDAMNTASSWGRQMVSMGILRLTGDAVKGSTASLESVGELMGRWQRLVTAIGGSKRGFRGLRGRMNADVISSTKLLLHAGPSQGSVMLEFQPEMRPETELSPDGELRAFDQPDTQLADEAVAEAITLFTNAAALGPSADGSDFLSEVSGLGARTASALADVARSLDAGGFDLDLTWMQPEHPSARVHVSQSVSKRIVEIVSSRELDKDIETLVGSIQTISTLARLHLLLDDGSLVAIAPGKLDHDALKSVTHGQRVRIDADVKVNQRPGDEPMVSYTARTLALAEADPRGPQAAGR